MLDVEMGKTNKSLHALADEIVAIGVGGKNSGNDAVLFSPPMSGRWVPAANFVNDTRVAAHMILQCTSRGLNARFYQKAGVQFFRIISSDSELEKESDAVCVVSAIASKYTLALAVNRCCSIALKGLGDD